MELHNAQYIEIITTLEMIDKANKAIGFHKQLANPDLMAIQQYERLRCDYMQQLSNVLQDFQIEIRQSEKNNTEHSFFHSNKYNVYANNQM